ncbi:sialate O-acetylesterase [Lacticaseibacillus rhamnosus]
MEQNQDLITIISAGQSNIDGRVPVAELPADVHLPLANCYYCSNYTPDHDKGVFQPSLKVSDLSEKRWGFDLITYYNILRQTDYQNLHVIKCSEGGTSIDPTSDGDHHWTTHFDELATPKDSLLLAFTHLIEQCRTASQQQLDIKAMLWHQGEADRASYSQVAADHYYANLKAVFAYCRKLVGNPTLPIICGTVSHHSEQYDPQVEKDMIRLATEDPNIHLIDMQHGTLLDAYHFDAKSSEFFGQQVFNCLIDEGIFSGKRLAMPAVKIY